MSAPAKEEPVPELVAAQEAQSMAVSESEWTLGEPVPEPMADPWPERLEEEGDGFWVNETTEEGGPEPYEDEPLPLDEDQPAAKRPKPSST